MDWSLAAQALLWLPIETGAARVVRVDRIARSVGFLLSSQIVVVASVVLLAAIVVRSALTRIRGYDAEPIRMQIVAVLLALGLLASSLLFLAITKNHPANGSPFVFVSLGLTHQVTRSFLPVARLRIAEAALAVVFGVVLAVDAWTFQVRVNVSRMANDLVFRPALAASPVTAELSFLRLQTPARSGVTAGHLDRLVEFLRSREGAVFLLGDSSIIYALTGRESLSPSLWFHPGLTFPEPSSPAFPAWDAAIEHRLSARDVRWVVLEGQETWMQGQARADPFARPGGARARRCADEDRSLHGRRASTLKRDAARRAHVHDARCGSRQQLPEQQAGEREVTEVGSCRAASRSPRRS